MQNFSQSEKLFLIESIAGFPFSIGSHAYDFKSNSELGIQVWDTCDGDENPAGVSVHIFRSFEDINEFSGFSEVLDASDFFEYEDDPIKYESVSFWVDPEDPENRNLFEVNRNDSFVTMYDSKNNFVEFSFGHFCCTENDSIGEIVSSVREWWFDTFVVSSTTNQQRIIQEARDISA